MDANPLTTQYGMLKGWQWVGVVGTLGAVYLYLRGRNAPTTGTAAGDAINMAGQATDAEGNPIPGSQILAPIIIQNGPPSTPITPTPVTPLPTPKPPAPKPKPPTTLPKVNAGDFAQTVAKNSALAKTMIKIGTVGKDGKYVGKNVRGGVPVYERSSASGSFYQGKFSAGHDVYIPSQFAAYVV